MLYNLYDAVTYISFWHSKVYSCIIELEEELEEISGDGYWSNQETNTTDDYSVHLPAYLACLSLGFRVISVVITVLMSC